MGVRCGQGVSPYPPGEGLGGACAHPQKIFFSIIIFYFLQGTFWWIPDAFRRRPTNFEVVVCCALCRGCCKIVRPILSVFPLQIMEA